MHFIITFVFVLLTCFCHGRQTNSKQLPDNFKCDYKNSNEAFKAAQQAIALFKKNNLHDTVYGKSYNIYAIYHDFAGNKDSAFYYYKKSLKALARYPAVKIYPLINICSAYNENGEHNKAIQLAAEGIAIVKRHPNTVNNALLYQMLGISHFYKQEIETSVSYFTKGIALLKNAGDVKYLPLLNLSLANTYLHTTNYRFARDLYEDYIKGSNHTGERTYNIAQVNYAECLIALQDYKAAKKILLAVLPVIESMDEEQFTAVITAKLGYLENIENNISRALVYYRKAATLLISTNSHFATLLLSDYITLLNKINAPDEALQVIGAFNKSGYRKASPSERIEYQKAVAETYRLKKDYYNSTIALNEVIRLNDSLWLTENNTAEKELQAKFQTERQREKNIELQKQSKLLQGKVKNEQRMIILYVVLSIIIIVLILSMLRASWLKNRLQKTELKAVAGQKILMVQQHQYEKEINNRQKEAIEEKHRELTSYALRLASYQDNINSIIDKCGTDEFRTIEDVKRHLKSLITHTDYWKQFETRFNNLHPEFTVNLAERFTRLTKNDLEFCTLLRLKLSNKEIASLLQISHESVITKKYRIKKKMEITDDAEFEKILLRF